jgi:hypothetical protein
MKTTDEKYEDLCKQFARFTEAEFASVEYFQEKNRSKTELRRHIDIAYSMQKVCETHGIFDDGSTGGCPRLRERMLLTYSLRLGVKLGPEPWFDSIGIENDGPRSAKLVVNCKAGETMPTIDYFVGFSPFSILLRPAA